MSELKIRTRAVGATSVMRPKELPQVTSETGGTIGIVTSVSEPGFNPLDLLYSSLSACIVLSARIAASRFGVLDRLTEVSARVTGEKAHDEPSRIGKFEIVFDIKGDFDDATRHAIAEAAENEICTVSNTLRGNPEFVTRYAD